MKIGNSDLLTSGREIMCVGYPGVADDLQVSRGMISSRQLSKGDSFPFITTNAVANYGNSGSPIFDVETGEVIGVLAAGKYDEMRLGKKRYKYRLPITECSYALTYALNSEIAQTESSKHRIWTFFSE